MKKYKYVGESDELTTNGKVYEVKDDNTFIDDTGTSCGLSSSFGNFFKLVEEQPTTPGYYNNENGSIYKFCNDQSLNAWESDIVKRVVRCRNKGEWRSDLEKTKVLIDLYLSEYTP